MRCDGCQGNFSSHELLEFAGNVSAIGGGGFIGNCLVDAQFSKTGLGMLWANAGCKTLQQAMADIEVQCGDVTLPVVVRRLRYCQTCTLRIIYGAFETMRTSIDPRSASGGPLQEASG